MFELFMEKMKPSQGLHVTPSLSPVLKEFKISINKVMNYYRTGESFVSNEHLLVRIIKQIPAPQGEDIRRWYYNAQDYAEGICGMFDIIDSTNFSAKPAQKLFMGGIGEILVSINRPITMNLQVKDWLDTDSVVVLSHPYTDMRVRPLDGHEFTRPILGDHAVIGIDLALLYVQYHLWRRKVAPEQFKNGSIPTLHNWVYQYPLVNALRSYLNMSMYNRFYCLYKGYPATKYEERAKVGLAYTDYTHKLDDCLKLQIEWLKTQQLSYPELLANIPLIMGNSPNALTFFRLDSAYVTRQIRWCYLAARINVIEFLLEAQDIKIKGSDRYYDDKWKYGIRNIASEFTSGYPTTPLLSERVKALGLKLK